MRVRRKTQASFDRWIGTSGVEEEVLALISEGNTLVKVALKLKRPYRCLQAHFRATQERIDKYNKALQDYADVMEHEAKDIADGAKHELGAVAKAKLQVEVRRGQARALNRERWGERLQVEKTVKIGVDEVLLGRAAELLRLQEKEVKGLPEPVEAEKEDALDG